VSATPGILSMLEILEILLDVTGPSGKFLARLTK